MARKQTVEGGKKNEIIGVALQLFLENGYDGTSVRSIQKKVNSEIGLFYYYFKNKDDLFDHVLDRFFEGYNKEFAAIVEHGRRNPCRLMQDFFEYMERETALFREKYSNNIHRTMRWAIRERTLEIIEPYLEQVVEIQSSYYGVKPALGSAVTAMYLTHGVGSYILHTEQDLYFKNRAEIKRGTSLLMGMPAETQELRTPYPATPDDIESCMELASAVRESFPGFDEDEYREKLKGYIERSQAWVYRNNGRVVAALLYSGEGKTLDYLAVHPDYRRCGLAGRLVETMAAQFPIGTDISVITYCEDDPAGVAAGAFYKRLGFAEAEKVECFGYPCRRMVLTAQACAPCIKGDVAK